MRTTGRAGGYAAAGLAAVDLVTLATAVAVGGGTDPATVPGSTDGRTAGLLVLEALKLANAVLLVGVVLALRRRFRSVRAADVGTLAGLAAAAALTASGLLGAWLLLGTVGVAPAVGDVGGAVAVVSLAGTAALGASGLFRLAFCGHALRAGVGLSRRTAALGVAVGALAWLTAVVPPAGLPLLVLSAAWYGSVGRELLIDAREVGGGGRSGRTGRR